MGAAQFRGDACREHQLPVDDVRRMVPIFLTTATTAVGVVPMMFGGSTFWAPVGVTIFAGGIGSLILVVTILPVLYSKIYK